MRASQAVLIGAAALALVSMRASAQVGADGAGRYPLHNINFDMWCQEQRHLPPERCDKRLPQDDAEYQAYVAKIQNYEIQYLQKQRDEEDLNRVILHNNPVDHQTDVSAPVNNQGTTTPPPPQ